MEALGDKSIFARMMKGLPSEAAFPKTVMIDVSRHAPLVRACLRKYLKAHRTATSQRRKRGSDDPRGRLIGRTTGGMNTTVHTVTDADIRPISFSMTAGQVSDNTGAATRLGSLPKAGWLLADRGYRAGKRHRFKRTGEG
jgi:Transposase DDE domain